jgi:hypothetical protein
MKHMNHAEYQRKLKSKSEAELRFIIKDATEAQEVNPTNANNGYYADEVHYCLAELRRRAS